MSVAWSEVTSVHRDVRDIVAFLADSRRELRFGCHSYDEALRGTCVARSLLTAAAV